jgi:hypothetical protein
VNVNFVVAAGQLYLPSGRFGVRGTLIGTGTGGELGTICRQSGPGTLAPEPLSQADTLQ